MSDVGSFGGGDAGGGSSVAIPDSSPLGPSVPSGSDLNSDRGRNKVRVGLDGKDIKSRDRGRGDADAEPHDAPAKQGKRRRDVDDVIRKAVGKSAERTREKDAAKAGLAPAPAAEAATSAPPQRFAEDARGEWNRVPESVRRETHRMQRELEAGIARYRQGALRDVAVEPYHRLATQYGTTVPAYLENVIGLELQLKSSDPNDKVTAVERFLRVGGISPENYAAFVAQDTPAARAARHTGRQLGALTGQVNALGEQVAQTQYQQMADGQHREVSATVDGFAVGHDDFEALSGEIAAEIRADPRMHEPRAQRLASAYDSVKRRKRNGSRSISGSPGGDVDVTRSRPRDGKHPSIDESIRNAARRFGV